MTVVASAQASEDVAKPYDQFVLFGDSITELSLNQGLGFAAGLQEAYSRKLDVINRGFAGYTTALATKIFPKSFPMPKTGNVRLMTIFFGANDSCVPDHRQHVPLEEYKKNLQKIIEHPATRTQNPRVIIITPPPVNEYQLEEFDIANGNPHPTRTARNAQAYAQAACEVGASMRVPVADIWTAFMAASGWQEDQALVGSCDVPNSEQFSGLFTDGLHLTTAGYHIVFEEVMKVIHTHYPDQAPERLPMVYPAPYI